MLAQICHKSSNLEVLLKKPKKISHISLPFSPFVMIALLSIYTSARSGECLRVHLYMAGRLTKRNWLFIKAPILGVQWQILKSEAKTQTNTNIDQKKLLFSFFFTMHLFKIWSMFVSGSLSLQSLHVKNRYPPGVVIQHFIIGLQSMKLLCGTLPQRLVHVLTPEGHIMKPDGVSI